MRVQGLLDGLGRSGPRSVASGSGAIVVGLRAVRRIHSRRSLPVAVVAACAFALAPASASAEAGASAAAWGANGSSQLGVKHRTKKPYEPTGVVGLPPENIEQMASGRAFSLALMANGQVWSVGNDSFGKLGNGERGEGTNRIEWGEVLELGSPGHERVTQISAGGDHALALTAGGKVMAWGSNLYGERGNGESEQTEKEPNLDTPKAVTKLEQIAQEEHTTIAEIASAKGTDYARLSNGKVEAWGIDEHGQLGRPAPEACVGEHIQSQPCSRSPLPVMDGRTGGELTGVERISAGDTAGYALLKDHTVVSWGDNRHGELGDGINSGPEECGPERHETPCSRVAVKVSGLEEVEAISGGTPFALALVKGHKVWGWGGDGPGEIGNKPSEQCVVTEKHTPRCSRKPVPVEGGELGSRPVTAISAGTGFSLLLTEEGSVYALGEDKKGKLGDGKRGGKAEEPKLVKNLGPPSANTGGVDHTVAGIAAGEDHSFAILKIGTARLSPIVHGSVFGSRLNPSEPMPEITVEPEVNALLAVWRSSAPWFKIRWKRSSESTYKNQNGEWIPGPCEPCSYPIESFNGAPLEYVPYDIEVGKHESYRGTLIPPSLKFSEVTPLAPEIPRVTSIERSYGPHSGGTTVAITGENLGATDIVRFGSAEAQNVTVESENNSETTISATAPEGTGTVDVTVADEEEGTSARSPADQFTYGPVVSSVAPNEGPTTGGTSVTITGGNLSEASAVKFGSVSATSFTVNSDESITATAPPETEGTVDVTVSGPAGTSALVAGDHFTFTPTITKVNPSSGSKLGGTVVTVTGTGFATGESATKVAFGGITATAGYCATSTECVVISPAHAVGVVDVTAIVNAVSSPKSATDQFTYSEL